jgi:uncharacterized protein (DUF885 family)
MSNWLVPLLLIGLAAGLLFGGLLRSDSGPVSPPESVVVADTPGSGVQLPATWDGLPVDVFLERASATLVARYPQTVTALGIGDVLGMGDGDLNPLSMAYTLETQALEAAIAERLSTYDIAEVSEASRLSARVYGRWLERVVEGHPFTDHTYLVSPFITSYPQFLERFLTATHPVRSERNAEDYIQRLSQIKTRYDELLESLAASEAVGAVPSSFILKMTLDQLRPMADVGPTDSPLYTTFEERLDHVTGLSRTRRGDLLAEAAMVIETSVLPAYDRLIAYVTDLIVRAPEGDGVWKHEDGDGYYAYLLRDYTTTDLTPDEIHEIGLAEAARIQEEIRAAATDLGYEPSLSFVEIFAGATEASGTVIGEETVAECERILAGIEERVTPVFHRFPEQGLEIVSGGANAFYAPGPLDGSRPALFYAPAGVERPRYRLPTLVHHEAIPGHHFQISFAHEAGLPGYRAGLSFTAYAEGWALYVERLAWELGAYDDDPLGDLGRLQDELFRAVRLVVDTGLHAKRWSYEDAVEYMLENAGLDEDYVRSEVVRYIVLPGQATAYKIGMLKMLELRDRAAERLGESFDLADFHNRVLREGSVPLDILEELVDAYIDETLSGG